MNITRPPAISIARLPSYAPRVSQLSPSLSSSDRVPAFPQFFSQASIPFPDASIDRWLTDDKPPAAFFPAGAGFGAMPPPPPQAPAAVGSSQDPANREKNTLPSKMTAYAAVLALANEAPGGKGKGGSQGSQQQAAAAAEPPAAAAAAAAEVDSQETQMDYDPAPAMQGSDSPAPAAAAAAAAAAEEAAAELSPPAAAKGTPDSDSLSPLMSPGLSPLTGASAWDRAADLYIRDPAPRPAAADCKAAEKEKQGAVEEEDRKSVV